MKDRLKLELQFDADAMRRDLSRLEALEWTDHFVPQNYEGTWSVLPLRAPAGAKHPIQMIYSDPGCDAFVDTPLLARCTYFPQLLAAFQCPLHAVRLMKLTPGSIIKPHADHDLAAEHGRVRLHIPVVTNPDVDFRLNGEAVVMRDGECWYLRLSDIHSVANRGRTDRVHLVIDALVSPWLDEQLAKADRAGNGAVRLAPSASGANADVAADAGSDLTGWIPCKIRTDRTVPVVDWCYLGDDTFTEPFFAQTVERCVRNRRHQQSVRQTPIEALIERAASEPGIAPSAFVFHTSRCGSTLVSQMAKTVPQTLAISEATPIDDVLRAQAPSDKTAWLQALVSTLGQRRRGDERHLVVKFDAWHILDLDLIQRACPDVPCLFLYRDPAAVIASQLRMPGIHTVPGMVDPSIIGLGLDDVQRLDRNEYIGRMLAAIYSAGLAAAKKSQVMLMNYAELPGAAATRLLEWCGATGNDDIRDRVLGVAQFDAKTPSLTHDPTEAARRPARNLKDIDFAHGFIAPYYEELELLRRF